MTAELLIGFWLAKIGLWVFLIWSSFRLGLIRRYPIVFAYIFAAIILEIVVYGVGRYADANLSLYRAVYFASYLVILCLASWAVLRIYWMYGPVAGWRHIHLLLIPVGLVCLALSDSPPIYQYMRVLNIAGSIVFYWGFATLSRMLLHRDCELGWNLKMVLLAITVPFAFNSLVLMVAYLGVDISYEAVNWWIKGGALTSWIILAVGMSEYSPPRFRRRIAQEPPLSGGDSGPNTNHFQTGKEPDYALPGRFFGRRHHYRSSGLAVGSHDGATVRPSDP